MGRASLRNDLLEAGVTILHERGFSATGVRDIMEAAGAPLGSFTNHFRSKERFALLVLERYFDRLSAIMDATLRNEAISPLDRIDSYFAEIDQLARPVSWGYGCMIANFGLEMPTLSESIRVRLAQMLEGLTEPFAAALRDGQADGQVRTDLDADDLAMLVLSAWHGAVLRSKVERSGKSMSRASRTLRPLLAAVDRKAGSRGLFSGEPRLGPP